MPNERRRRSDLNSLSVAERRTRPARNVTDDQVRGRAYELYEAGGSAHGHDVDDWLQAERELRNHE